MKTLLMLLVLCTVAEGQLDNAPRKFFILNGDTVWIDENGWPEEYAVPLVPNMDERLPQLLLPDSSDETCLKLSTLVRLWHEYEDSCRAATHYGYLRMRHKAMVSCAGAGNCPEWHYRMTKGKDTIVSPTLPGFMDFIERRKK